jgi:hypothetical protein
MSIPHGANAGPPECPVRGIRKPSCSPYRAAVVLARERGSASQPPKACAGMIGNALLKDIAQRDVSVSASSPSGRLDRGPRNDGNRRKCDLRRTQTRSPAYPLLRLLATAAYSARADFRNGYDSLDSDLPPRRTAQGGVSTAPRVAAPPFRVFAHQPDAKMSERRLGNLLRVVAGRALRFDRVG